MHTPSEIRHLQFAMHTQEDVLRFDISMYYVFLVQKLQRSNHLRNILRSFPFRESGLPLQVFV